MLSFVLLQLAQVFFRSGDMIFQSPKQQWNGKIYTKIKYSDLVIAQRTDVANCIQQSYWQCSLLYSMGKIPTHMLINKK